MVHPPGGTEVGNEKYGPGHVQPPGHTSGKGRGVPDRGTHVGSIDRGPQEGQTRVCRWARQRRPREWGGAAGGGPGPEDSSGVTASRRLLRAFNTAIEQLPITVR